MISTVVLLLCSIAVGVQGAVDTSKSCAHTRSTFNDLSVMDPNGNPIGLTGQVFTDLQQVSQSVCQLSETCCSNEAEGSLKSFIVEEYRDNVVTRLSDPLMVCHNHTFFDEYKLFLEGAKNSLVGLMRITYGIYFLPYLNIYDKFYSYLQGTVDTGDTCRFAEEWNEVFYEVYLASYFGHPSTQSSDQLPQTFEFRQCFYDYFLETQGDKLSTNLNGFLRTYNRAMRYFRALRTLDRVVESTVDYLLKPECQKSIMKMTHCSSCAGYVSQTCDGLCLNVLRGCMVDLSDMFEPLEDLGRALVKMETQLTTENGLYYLWGQLNNLDSAFFTMISTTSSIAPSLERTVLARCGAEGRREKREVLSNLRVRRAVVDIPVGSLNHSAYCVSEALSVLKTLPDSVCDSVTNGNTQCWNGQTVGSYGRDVLGFDRDSQKNNPEMVVKRRSHFEQQIANIKAATRELDILTGTYECGTDDEDEDCTIPDTCTYFNIPNAPIPELPDLGSGSGSGDFTSGGSTDIETTSVPVVPTTPTQPAPTTKPVETTTQPEPSTTGFTPSIPGGEVTGPIVTGGPFTGPGGDESTVGVQGPVGGSSVTLTVSTALILLFSLFTFLL